MPPIHRNASGAILHKGGAILHGSECCCGPPDAPVPCNFCNGDRIEIPSSLTVTIGSLILDNTLYTPQVGNCGEASAAGFPSESGDSLTFTYDPDDGLYYYNYNVQISPDSGMLFGTCENSYTFGTGGFPAGPFVPSPIPPIVGRQAVTGLSPPNNCIPTGLGVTIQSELRTARRQLGVNDQVQSLLSISCVFDWSNFDCATGILEGTARIRREINWIINYGGLPNNFFMWGEATNKDYIHNCETNLNVT